VTSVRERKRIDIVVRLAEWDDHSEFDRLGVEEKFNVILGTAIRELTVPVRPGRDMGTILEIAARNELLRKAGTNSSLEFMGRLEQQLVTRAAIDESTKRAQLSNLQSGQARQRDSSGELQRSNESSAWIPAVRPKGEE
jgi:HPr kinase/phosphorylase